MASQLQATNTIECVLIQFANLDKDPSFASRFRRLVRFSSMNPALRRFYKMPKLKLLLTQLCVCAALTTFFGTVRAQQVSLATNRSGKPPFEGLSLTGDDKRKIFFNVRKVGSIKGRTFS